jgi:TetR/AcrR family transcriptional regulator, transcriptional repressor for nem operon
MQATSVSVPEKATKGKETRERILLRAAEIFNDKGYFGASMNDLVAATGLTKGGLYNHFESKEALAMEAFDYSLQLYRERFAEAIEGKSNAVDRLLAVIDMTRRGATDPAVPGGCPLLNNATASDDALLFLRERARNAMDRWRSAVARIVEAGIASGQIRADVDPADVASWLIGSLQGGTLMSRLYQDPMHSWRAADYLDRYVEEKLRAKA